MKTLVLRKLSVLSAMMALTFAISATAPKAHAQGSDYIYCELRDNPHSVVYYSDIFVGNYYYQRLAYANAFTDDVHGRFSNVIGVATCFVAENPSDARAKEDRDRSTDRGIYRQLVDTGWTFLP